MGSVNTAIYDITSFCVEMFKNVKKNKVYTIFLPKLYIHVDCYIKHTINNIHIL